METNYLNKRVLICPTCGFGRYAITADLEEYCTRCGHLTLDKCPECEKPFVDPEGSFCYYCGVKVVSVEPDNRDQFHNLQRSQNSYQIPTPSKNCLQLVPGRREDHHHTNTVIITIDRGKQEIQLSNAAFDFLYVLAWLRNQNLPPMASYQKLSSDVKSQIFPRYFETSRFNYKWSQGDPKSISHYIWQINLLSGRKLIQKSGSQISLDAQFEYVLQPY